MAAISLRWWDDAATMRARLTKQFPRLTQGAQIDEVVTLRWRGKVEEGNKIFEEIHLVMPDGFRPLRHLPLFHPRPILLRRTEQEVLATSVSSGACRITTAPAVGSTDGRDGDNA